MANTVQHFTDQNFEQQVLQSDVPVLVDFWAEWCGPCRALGPTIEELAQAFDGKAVVGKVDIDNNPNVATQFEVRSIPTVLVFKGGKPVAGLVGVQSRDVYERALKEAGGAAA